MENLKDTKPTWLDTQKHGQDYDETFSPVVRFASLRIAITLVYRMVSLKLHQMDVTTAFLNGEVKEEVLRSSST